MMVLILQFVAPSLLAGSLGAAIGVLQTPLAGVAIKLGKRMARGEHLDASEKAFIKRYNTGRTDSELVHGW